MEYPEFSRTEAMRAATEQTNQVFQPIQHKTRAFESDP
jgi:hypothetical protein